MGTTVAPTRVSEDPFMRVTPENMWMFEIRRLPVDTGAPAKTVASSSFASALQAASDPLQRHTGHHDHGTSPQDPQPTGPGPFVGSGTDPAPSGPIDIHGKPDHSHAVSTMTDEEADRMFRLSGEIRGTGVHAAVPPGMDPPPPGYFYDPATGYQPGFTLVYGNITDYLNPIAGILKPDAQPSS